MKNSFLLLTLQLLVIQLSAQVVVTNLKCEDLVNPIGIGNAKPRFSWQIVSERRNSIQSTYELNVSLNKTIVWSSGKISSDQSLYISYGGSPLASGNKYTWQVRVSDNHGTTSPWSEPATFQVALLNTSDWKAAWIEPGFAEDTINRPSPLLRKQFKTSKKILSAYAYITAHGMYDGYINGKRIGDCYLTPGWDKL